MKTQHTVTILVGVVLGGLALRKWFTNTVVNKRQEQQKLADLDSNPWLLKLEGFNAYQYYASNQQYTRWITSPDGELNLVSTDMLNQALNDLHAQITQEMQFNYRNPYNYDTYFNSADMNNPYWQAINHAVEEDATNLQG